MMGLYYMKCYLCKSPISLLFAKAGYRIYRCSSCGLEMTDLQKNYDTFLTEQYAEGYFTGDPHKRAYVSYENDKSYIVRNMKKIFAYIPPLKPSGTLLDVGCAMGYFVELALVRGYDAYGFDPSEFAVEKAKILVGPKRIKQGSVHTIQYASKFFDVITLLDVFEHLRDPIKDLAKLTTFLKDDGILLIATGDTGSLITRLTGRRWTFYNPPQHLFFFSRSTLSKLLGRVGLAPIQWFRIGKWVSAEYVLHLAETLSESVLAKILHPIASKTALGRLPLYLPLRDNMIVIAKKENLI